MSRRFVIFVFAMVFVVAVGAQQKAPAPPKSAAPASDEAQIRAEGKAWFESKDAATFASFYAPDATLLPPNEKAIGGKAGITTYWTNFFKMPGLTFTGAVTKIEVAKSGDLAFDRGTYKASMTGPDGKPVTENGKYLVVWKKQADGRWKAYQDMFSSDAPAPPPQPKPAAKQK